MKKSIKSVTMLVVSISMVAMLLCSSVANAQTGSKFIYDMKENVSTVYTLDESGKHLTPKLKYEYAKDENGNVLNKKAYRWNNEEKLWTPYYQVNFTEEGSKQTAEFAQWNDKEESFSLNKQKMIYNKGTGSELMEYQAYNWNPSLKTWDLTQQLISQNYLVIK